MFFVFTESLIKKKELLIIKNIYNFNLFKKNFFILFLFQCFGSFVALALALHRLRFVNGVRSRLRASPPAKKKAMKPKTKDARTNPLHSLAQVRRLLSTIYDCRRRTEATNLKDAHRK
jgi:hypothetical protein